MNKYDKERIEMIIVMIMYITKLPEQVIIKLIKKTDVYKNIMNGDEVTLYDGYSANLMEMVEEWQEQQDIPKQMKDISAQAVNRCNDWLRDNEFDNAKQARDALLEPIAIRRTLRRTKQAAYRKGAVAARRRMRPKLGRRTGRSRVSLKAARKNNRA